MHEILIEDVMVKGMSPEDFLESQYERRGDYSEENHDFWRRRVISRIVELEREWCTRFLIFDLDHPDLTPYDLYKRGQITPLSSDDMQDSIEDSIGKLVDDMKPLVEHFEATGKSILFVFDEPDIKEMKFTVNPPGKQPVTVNILPRMYQASHMLTRIKGFVIALLSSDYQYFVLKRE